MRWWLSASAVSFAFSIYAYHSAKVVVPLMVLLFAVQFRKDFLAKKVWVGMNCLLALFILLPFLYATVFSRANERAMSTTIFSSANVPLHFVRNLSEQFSPAYLIGGKDITYRHSSMQVGVLYRVELFLAIVGVVMILTQREWRVFSWVLLLALSTVVAPALGNEVPHGNRALLGLPWFQIIESVGLVSLLACIKRNPIVLGRAVMIGFSLAIIGSFLSFISIYQRVYSSSKALVEFGYGYEELVGFLRTKEGEVNRVYFTNFYGQPYIYLLFFKQLTPIEYRQGALANYTFTDHPIGDSLGQSNVLIVGTADQIPETASIIKEIKYPDGQVAFRVAKQ